MGSLTAYERWMRDEGVPIVDADGVEDVRQIPLQPWARTGGRGAFVQLRGMEGYTGVVVGEIAPRQGLLAQQHLFQTVFCVLDGEGAAEVWLPGREGEKQVFEWQKYSVFAIPLNCGYRLFNVGSAPCTYVQVTDAPLVIDLFHDLDFIFRNPYPFPARLSADGRGFQEGDRLPATIGRVWETNFIADVSRALVDPQERKGPGTRITTLELADGSLGGHFTEWPVGRYAKAHYHQGGAVLLILRSEGYTLMWPKEIGPRPYQAGRESEVVRVNWREGGLICPPTGWFHQHFNLGANPARQLAIRFTSNSKHPVGFYRAGSGLVEGVAGNMVDLREGGTMIGFEEEDPRIRLDFEAELRRRGAEMQMPAAAPAAGGSGSGKADLRSH